MFWAVISVTINILNVYTLYCPILLPLVSVLFSLGLARQIRQRKGCWPHQKSPGPDEAKLKNIFTIFKKYTDNRVYIILCACHFTTQLQNVMRENLPLPRSVGHSLLENIFAQDQVLLAAKCENAQKITCKMNNDVPLRTTYM